MQKTRGFPPCIVFLLTVLRPVSWALYMDKRRILGEGFAESFLCVSEVSVCVCVWGGVRELLRMVFPLSGPTKANLARGGGD